MTRALFVAGLRTPFGRAGKGAYQDVRPDDMLVELLGAHRQRYPALWEAGPDDLLVGCAYPEGEQGYNVARMVAVGAGLAVPGVTINRLCASSLEAVAVAAGRIRAGWARRLAVGGVESMSRVPRRGANFSESPRIKTTYPLAYIPNGQTAEEVARRTPRVTRGRQEDLAARSHEMAHTAFERGWYARQIFPFVIERDELIRYPVDRAKMASLPPAFEDNGVVTAATSSPLTDGAACGWVVEEAEARRLGCTSAIEIVDAAAAHVPPEIMGMGPVPATRTILERHRLAPGDLACVEINEAFAVQVLASLDELDITLDRVNTWGGAMALGHPLGASGLRLVMTLADRLQMLDQDGALGLATLCVGGGQGMSVLARYVKLAGQ
jgi:acetyl-CoA acetyltransferase family protein